MGSYVVGVDLPFFGEGNVNQSRQSDLLIVTVVANTVRDRIHENIQLRNVSGHSTQSQTEDILSTLLTLHH